MTRVPTLALLVGLLGSYPGLANTLAVTNVNDSGSGSLRDAIANAGSGDVIQFALAYPATINVATPLTVGKNLYINGPGPSNLAISGQNSVTVFIVNAGVTVYLQGGITIEAGSSLLGGCIFNAGTLVLNSITVTGCNSVPGNQLGGGIFNSGTLYLNGTTVSGNVAGTPGTPGVQGAGGGIYNYQGAVYITTSTITGNRTVGGVGGAGGGGVYNNGGTVNIQTSTISKNSSSAGGGVFNNGGTVIVGDTTVERNEAAGSGGGIANHSFGSGSSLLVGRSTIANNSAGGDSFADLQAGFGSPVDLPGGAGIASEGPAILENVTVAGNLLNVPAGVYVGGSGILNLGGLTVNFTTIALNFFTPTYNFHLVEGVGIHSSGSLTIKNSLLASNFSAECAGGGTSNGYNLSDDASCAGVFTQATDQNSTAAGLAGGAANNGGLTQTIALQLTSPAVDAIPPASCTDVNGNPILVDQRGISRPQGPACDIGAFEYSGSYVALAVNPTTVPLGGTTNVSATIRSVSAAFQLVMLGFQASGPAGPSCDSTSFIGTVPVLLPPNLLRTFTFPITVPTGACLGQYSVSVTMAAGGVTVGSAVAALTVTAP